MKPRGRPRKPDTNHSVVAVRVPDALYDALIREAKASGISVSELLRRRLFVNQKQNSFETRAQ